MQALANSLGSCDTKQVQTQLKSPHNDGKGNQNCIFVIFLDLSITHVVVIYLSNCPTSFSFQKSLHFPYGSVMDAANGAQVQSIWFKCCFIGSSYKTLLACLYNETEYEKSSLYKLSFRHLYCFTVLFSHLSFSTAPSHVLLFCCLCSRIISYSQPISVL